MSVRSGVAFSMPGMMDTILNLGLNDRSVEALASQAHSPAFAYDSYRRLVQGYGGVVFGLKAQPGEGDPFEAALEAAKQGRGVHREIDLPVEDLRGLVERFKAIVARTGGQLFPEDPWQQLWGAIEAVFRSWQGRRAVDYRRVHRIPDDLGTAVNVVAMVYGNMGEESGTGVAFTRNPPGAAEISKPREADFYGQDVPVQHEPGFIEPLTIRPREGRIRKIGVSGWTAPSGLAEGVQRSQISGWFAIGISMTWE